MGGLEGWWMSRAEGNSEARGCADKCGQRPEYLVGVKVGGRADAGSAHHPAAHPDSPAWLPCVYMRQPSTSPLKPRPGLTHKVLHGAHPAAAAVVHGLKVGLLQGHVQLVGQAAQVLRSM